MRLSKIKLAGFKSFVDSTTINFPTNLTGIVGPNGCGKSNVIDAIRWVLGEASAKTLRGDSMADVIFNGSSGRKPVGQASIELIFDNSDGTITGPYAGYAEVAVRRVVSRDGASQYYLNSSRCRRKDITHILLGTGVGSHGYSIIEQGMISRLVEAKPEELRAFLEEAAGISKYKERRRETEHRIRHTRENLERLTDIRDELDKQLQHLQRQARAAERYKLLKTEERRTTAELLLLRHQGLRADLNREEAELRARQLAFEAAVTATKEVDSRIEKLRVNLSDKHELFNSVQGVYYKVGAEIARLEQTIQHRRGTIARQESDLAEAEKQIAEIRGHIDSDRGQLEQLDRVLGQLNPELEEASSALADAEQELGAVESAVEEHRTRSNELAREIANAERMAQVDGAKVDQLDQRRVRAERGRAEQQEARDAIRLDEFEQNVEELVRDEENQRNEIGLAGRGVDSLNTEIRSLRLAQSDAADQLDAMREKLQQDRGRLSSLEALQAAALRKISAEAQTWLENNRLQGQPRLAEQLEVEAGWERAVETVLSGYFNAIDIDRLDSLGSDLAELSSSGLALVEAQGATQGDAPAGGLAPLSGKVTAPASAVGLLEGYYGAASLDIALRDRAALGRGETIVTPEGVVVTRYSIRTTASDDPQLGVIARGEEIDELREAIAHASRQSDVETGRLAELKEKVESLEAVAEEKQASLDALRSTYTETRAELEKTRARAEEARQRYRELDRAIVEFDDELAEIATIVDQGRTAVQLATTRKLELDEELERHAAEGAKLDDQLKNVRARTQAERERVKDISILVEARRSSKESATAALQRVQSQLAHLERRRRELSMQIAETREPIEGEEERLKALLDDRLSTESDLTAARKAVEECEAAVRSAESEKLDKQQVVDIAREAADTVRLAAREVQVRADTVLEQLTATGFDTGELQEGLDEGANVDAWSEKLESIGRRIQRLGSINLAAIDEYEEQSERKKYLDKQFDDLTGALETLEAAIRKIDRETRQRFRDTFDKANEGLGRLFPRLFGGGQAYLELDGDDLLSAGVTVMARPPGKRISTIHLMSGGEKALTAVALVFSIFELNPAPFCLLDEVDAPLDDANVGRFSEIVREMSEQVQFVLITHNKTTMETMNQLAGVTMHEPGVSRLVAVDIDEAVKLAAM